jgi:glycosyltransferase involved in cell wall biosynthesis
MKVLQICLKPPFPEVDGGCKAMHAITQGFLDNGIDVKVLTISTPKHLFQKENIPVSYLEKTQIEHTYIDTKVTPFAAFKNLFSSNSYNIDRFYSKEFEQLILKNLKEKTYDFILLETIFLSRYIKVIRENSNSKIVYRAHNVEHDIWLLNAVKEKGLKKWYFNYLAKKLKNAEVKSFLDVDGIATITSSDKYRFKDLGAKLPMKTIPYGINLADYKYEIPSSGNKVFHIGSMDWTPNEMGIKWLIKNVWANVYQKNNNAELNLAGRRMPGWLKSDNKLNINVLGEVDSAIDFINNNNIMVVPLLTGSGMRIKIIEGMVLGKLVITTSIGAEGINYTNKEDIVIANTPLEFVDAINYYIDNPEEQLRIGKAARELMEVDYDNNIIINNLIDFCNKL